MIKAKKSKNFLNNNDLLKEIILSKELGELTPKAIKMLMLLTEKAVGRLPYADNYYRQESEAYAMEKILRYWKNFDAEKSSNAFSFYTQIIKNGAAESFNLCYKLGKKIKGDVISLSGSHKCSSNHDEVYSI